jgi:hypothetical protein
MLIGLACLWSVVGRIPITANGKGVLVRSTAASNEWVSLTYFDANEVGQIQPGMEMLILSDRVSRAGRVGMIARVKTVSEPAVTTLAAARQTNLRHQDNLIEVVAELDQNSFSQVNSDLMPGMRVTARITLTEKAPITFVLPFLEGSQ